MGTFCPWRHFVRGHFVMGTFCLGDVLSWGHFVLVTFCHGDILSWWRFVVGTFCLGDNLSWGQSVKGTFCLGTLCPQGHFLRGDILYMGTFCPVTVRNSIRMLWFLGSHPHYQLEAQKGVLQAKTGCSTIDYRVSFGKDVLLGKALGDIFMLQTFGTPSLPSSYVKNRLPTSLSTPGSKKCPKAVEWSLMLWILGFPSHSQLQTQAQSQGVPRISLYHG